MSRAERVKENGKKRHDLWNITLTPASGADIEVVLPATSSCEAAGAVCTSAGRALSAPAVARVRGTAVLTAAFEGTPEAHDGEAAFTVSLVFSEPVTVSGAALGEHALAVDAGRVSAVRGPDEAGTRWQVTIKPPVTGAVTVSIAATSSCTDAGAVCTPTGKTLSGQASARIEGPAPLAARFEEVPASHDGGSLFTVRLAFNHAIATTAGELRRRALAVSGGRAIKAAKVDGRADLWEVSVRPSGIEAVGISLAATSSCTEAGAVCTATGNALWADVQVAVAGPDPTTLPVLTARFGSAPAHHQATSAFSVRLRFSAPVAASAERLQGALAVTNGSVTSVAKVRQRADLWTVEVTPAGSDEVGLSLAASESCEAADAVCTADGRALSAAASATVPGPGGLTARWYSAPNAGHDGEKPFDMQIKFSSPVATKFRVMRDEALTVTNGTVTSASRVHGDRSHWRIRIQPSSYRDVTVTLPATTDCEAEGAVCTADGRALTEGLQPMVVWGPRALSVSDASVAEGEGATLDFELTMNRLPYEGLTVTYETRDGTATAGSDYTATNGTLTFGVNDKEKTVSVPVLDDAVDEGEETVMFVVTRIEGAYSYLLDATATGTIENSDPLQKMWLSRFGRTVTDHVTEAVSDRLANPLSGAQVTVGGQTVDLARTGDAAWVGQTLTSLARLLGASGGPEPADDPGSGSGAGGWPGTGLGAGRSPAPPGGAPMRAVSGRELLLGSAFHLAREGDGGGPGLAAWGRVTAGGFEGEAPADAGTVRVDGRVTTGILGADAEWSRLLAGVAISVSEGEGGFDQPGVDSGTVESTMTVVSPYARFMAIDRLSVWGLAGWGTGDMTIVQDARAATDTRPARPRQVARTDIEMRLAAVGGRGALLQADESGGFDLALRADAFHVETESEPVSNEGRTTAEASRVRLVLEGGRAFQVGGGATLRPSLELGLRHDGGDAETGTGVELGGGVGYADPGSGLSVEARARMLVAHAASDYEEWGVSGSVRLAPGARGRGLSFSLAPTLGATSSAAGRLWGARDARGLAPGDGGFEAARGLQGELGYGLAVFGDRFTGTPNVGIGLADGSARDWRIGWRLTSAVRGGPGFEVNLDATRREAANGNEPAEHGVMLRGAIRW